MTILSQIMNFFTAESLGVRIAVTLLILVLGHLFVKLYRQGASRLLIERKENANRREIEVLRNKIQYSVYILDAAVIGAALFYLNAEVSRELYASSINALPNMVSIVLIAILGIVSVNIFAKLAIDFFKTVGLSTYMREAGVSKEILQVTETLLKAVLYLLILQFILIQANFAESTIQEFVRAASWAATFLIAGLIFYGFKDLFKNFAAGIYMKNSRAVRPGEEVKIDEESGEIKEVSLFSTTVDTNTGFTILAPNSKIMQSNIKFKRTKSDLDTLDEITGYFVAQHPSYCGPASMEMALEIFGYRHDQEEIGEKAGVEINEGVEEDELMDAVEELTNSEVKTAWVGYDKISDLGDEFKAWFNDGALIVPNFYKPEIFPDATAGHFVLAVGVEGEEALILDPSRANGGVYYVHKDQLKDAMAEFGHKRGYIVVAPKGTTAYWRIKNDLIYSDKNYYDQLSKTLESRLRKILRQGRLLKNSTPQSMEKYLEDWRPKEKLTRIWTPEKQENGEEDEDETSEDK